ncbi:NAD-dependent epimerase/dehydratase family protein [Sciscionella marina]|uniref:NAD-dependent epimerase/dehydratase family protein n=1 Tax=Sciscionella marina TaxID=508770 RepID=UPI00035E01BE|nr:NAD(P)-dependent oxidoreductase [Sciscionella marina]
MITGRRILVTGASGAVGSAVASALAVGNTVWGAARFGDSGAKERLEAAGVRPLTIDLAARTPRELAEELPDADYVLHFAVDLFTEPDFERAHRNNVEPAAMLVSRYRDAEAFLHCSSTAVYAPHPQPRAEHDPLGDCMREVFPTYSIGKIAAEAVVRSCARLFELPVTIARLNVPYGDHTGFPLMHLRTVLDGEPVAVHPGFPDVFAPIHLDDMVRTLPILLGAAGTPPTIVNWCGDEQVGIAEWTGYLARLAGCEASVRHSEAAIMGVCPDAGKLRELVGGPICTVSWRTGFRRMVEANR